MTDSAVATSHKPIWTDLGSGDAAAARDFYARLFDWDIHVSPDPQYGGYGRALAAGKDAAGIGPKMSPDQPSAWAFYIGTDDAEATSRAVEAAGGKVIAPVFDVGDQGRMGVFQDPAGAFFSVWQPTGMGGFQADGAGTFAWAELEAKNRDAVLPFYAQVFGWGTRRSPMGPGQPEYVEFLVDGESIAGANEPYGEGAPSHWLVYFGVDDVDASFDKAIGLGAKQLAEPQDFPGGRFAIITDPEGAAFGLLKMSA